MRGADDLYVDAKFGEWLIDDIPKGERRSTSTVGPICSSAADSSVVPPVWTSPPGTGQAEAGGLEGKKGQRQPDLVHECPYNSTLAFPVGH